MLARPFARRNSRRPLTFRRALLILMNAVLWLPAPACRTDSDSQSLRPRQLRDVPANRLAFRFSADVQPPAGISTEEPKQIQAIQQDFDSKRPDDALLRTLPSPDGQRALALGK